MDGRGIKGFRVMVAGGGLLRGGGVLRVIIKEKRL